MSFRSFWHLHLTRLRMYGTMWMLRRIFLKGLRLSVGLLLQPLAFIAHLSGIRKVNVGERHIGHLASEPDCLIKMVKLNLLPKRFYCISIPTKHIANECLLEYWGDYFGIIKNPVLKYLFQAATSYGLLKFDVINFVATETDAAKYFEINSMWGNRAPLLSLKELHRKKGYEVLQKFGMPANAWFVCLHVREGGHAPELESFQSYRNADIDNCRLAIQTITDSGGWVIRMGDSTMKKLMNLPNCIDYAHSKEKSDWMDIFLCAECKLFVGNTSGIFLVSTIFGRPNALVNMTPFAAKAFRSGDIYIPKLLREKKTGKYLNIPEIFNSSIANFRHSDLYRKSDLIVEENTSEDINELVKEALSRIKGIWKAPEGDVERQQKFNSFFKKEDYGSQSLSTIGSSFISKYEHLCEKK